MANFDAAFNKVIKFEGGYVNDKDDRGGETYLGIARNFHGKSTMWKYVDEAKAANPGVSNSKLTSILKKDTRIDDEVKRIYKHLYWDKVKGDELVSQKIAEQLFDMGVNAGIVTAIKLMQKTLNLTQTGKVDDNFVKLLNEKAN